MGMNKPSPIVRIYAPGVEERFAVSATADGRVLDIVKEIQYDREEKVAIRFQTELENNLIEIEVVWPANVLVTELDDFDHKAIAEPQWDRAHCWEWYVPEEIREQWDYLGMDAKVAAYLTAITAVFKYEE